MVLVDNWTRYSSSFFRSASMYLWVQDLLEVPAVLVVRCRRPNRVLPAGLSNLDSLGDQWCRPDQPVRVVREVQLCQGGLEDREARR